MSGKIEIAMACNILCMEKGSRWMKLGLVIAKDEKAIQARRQGKKWPELMWKGLIREEEYWLFDEQADHLAFMLRRALNYSGVLYDPKKLR